MKLSNTELFDFTITDHSKIILTIVMFIITFFILYPSLLTEYCFWNIFELD